MFIRSLKVNKGNQNYEYLKIVESIREDGKIKQKTLVNLGNVANWPSDKLQKLIAILASFIDMPIDAVTSSPLEDVEISDRKILGPYLPLAELWEQLGLDAIISNSLPENQQDPRYVACIKALVFTQLVSPRSKLSTFEYVAKHSEIPGVDGQSLPLQCYYRSLNALAGAQKSIETSLHQRLQTLFNRDLSLVFYDLTSSYFEGTHCAMAKHGYSRDHRSDCLQVEIGLLVDNNGVPIGHDVFEGNIKDVATVLNALDRLQQDFSIKRCVFVGDDGMASEDNLRQVSEHGYEYITSLSLGKSIVGQQLLTAAPERKKWRELKDISCYIHEFPADAESTGIKYVGTFNVARAASTREKRGRRLRACLTFIHELQEKNQKSATLKAANKKLIKAERFLRQKCCHKFFSLSLNEENKLCYAFKREIFRQEWRTDGVLILKSNTTTLSAEEIVRGYRSLWMAENAFRHLKDPLHLRPIRHWSDPRVLGHIFVCVLAFTLERLYDLALQKHQLNISARKALEELSAIETVSLHAQGKTIRKCSKISAEQQKLLSAVGIKEVMKLW